jgi:glycosyltransferase involved in cell wall biosynthesis
MNDFPLASILIANYNNGKFITETLDSAINQSYKNIEIIIVDDASTDNSVELIENYIRLPPEYKIELFKNNFNYGCGRTKRKCVDIARGDFFAFLDPDDTIELNAVETLLEQFGLHPECSIVYSTHYLCNEQLEPQSISDWVGAIPAGQSHLNSTGGHISAFALCSKKCYDQTLGIDPKFVVSEDQDMYLKMEEVAPVFYFDKPLYYYRKHDNNISWNEKKQ